MLRVALVLRSTEVHPACVVLLVCTFSKLACHVLNTGGIPVAGHSNAADRCKTKQENKKERKKERNKEKY